MALLSWAKPKAPPTLYTEKEAAQKLGVSVFTVARLRKKGEIGFTEIGGRFRYSPKAIGRA